MQLNEYAKNIKIETLICWERELEFMDNKLREFFQENPDIFIMNIRFDKVNGLQRAMIFYQEENKESTSINVDNSTASDSEFDFNTYLENEE